MRRLFALSVALLVAGPAGAVCFPEATWRDAGAEYAHSTLVVTAQVTGEEDIPTPSDPNVDGGTLYTMRIVERFKGAQPAAVQVYSENSSGRFPMERGQTYLLFLDPPRDGRYAVNNCGRSADVRERGDVLAAFRAKQTPPR